MEFEEYYKMNGSDRWVENPHSIGGWDPEITELVFGLIRRIKEVYPLNQVPNFIELNLITILSKATEFEKIYEHIIDQVSKDLMKKKEIKEEIKGEFTKGKEHVATASMVKGAYCKKCGWPVVESCCNDEFKGFKDAKERDFWRYCSNKGCVNHDGGGMSQDMLKWIGYGTRILG